MILAVDPGLTGALAAYTGHQLAVSSMPVTQRPAGARRLLRPFLDTEKILGQVRGAAARGYTLVIEHVGGIPGQSAPAAFQFGEGCGLIKGMALACGMPVELVHAATWKSALRVPADKKRAVLRANELLPDFAHLWAIRRGECNQEQASGRAEAAMLALYGFQILGRIE